MNNSEKILKSLSSLIENGILTSKDIKKEISTDLKFKKDKIIGKLDLVTREEFEILKKIVQKQDAIIKKLNKSLILDTINIFGYKRCMFASNFPVDGILASFDEIYYGFKEITSEMTDDKIKCLFHDNAMKYYNPL